MSENQITIDGEVTSEISDNTVTTVGNLTGKPQFNQATSNAARVLATGGEEKLVQSREKGAITATEMDTLRNLAGPYTPTCD